MNTTALLTSIIPTINAVRGGGAFNVVIARQASGLAERVRLAANDDRIVVSPLLDALAQLDAATAFETQQAAMNAVVTEADALLGQIMGGNAVVADRIAPAARDLVARITTDVASLQDVFRPDPSILRRMRTDASELSVLVDAEIREGLRPGEHAYLAAQVFDQADRLEEATYAQLETAAAEIARHVRALAA